MKTIFLIIMLSINSTIFSQDNWDPNLFGVNNIYVKVDLCQENKEYEYLQYELKRDVILILKKAEISIIDNEDSDYILSIAMTCHDISSSYNVIDINVRLREKVYIKRIKSFERAILYENQILGHIPKGIEGHEMIKTPVLDILKNFILDYRLDNP